MADKRDGQQVAGVESRRCAGTNGPESTDARKERAVPSACLPSPRMSEMENLVDALISDAQLWEMCRCKPSSLDCEHAKASAASEAALLTAIRALVEDSERLDWLEGQASEIHPGVTALHLPWRNKPLREAIDRARSTEPVNTEPE
jgi:hypothetical protein